MWLLNLKSILVATDFDESSVPALRTAARLAPLAGASLHLLHVETTPAHDAVDHLREYFRRTVPDAPQPDSVQVLHGSPSKVIVEHATGLDADAVILGPHRERGPSGAMGSTAGSVVRTSPCPCLVLATELRLPLQRVLVTIDLAEESAGSLSVALSWASALRPRGGRAQLTALHVAQGGTATGAEAAVHAEVERARERAGGAAQVDIGETVARGADPATEILRSASSESADLLVMGTRRAGGAPSDLGSVSTAVARATTCPLLLVPPATWENAGH